MIRNLNLYQCDTTEHKIREKAHWRLFGTDYVTADGAKGRVALVVYQLHLWNDCEPHDLQAVSNKSYFAMQNDNLMCVLATWSQLCEVKVIDLIRQLSALFLLSKDFNVHQYTRRTNNCRAYWQVSIQFGFNSAQWQLIKSFSASYKWLKQLMTHVLALNLSSPFFSTLTIVLVSQKSQTNSL